MESRSAWMGGPYAAGAADRLNVILHSFVDAQYDCWNHSLLPALRAANIHLLGARTGRPRTCLRIELLRQRSRSAADAVTIDPSHPSPGC